MQIGLGVFNILLCISICYLLPVSVATVTSVSSYTELDAVLSNPSYTTEETIIYVTQNISVSGRITLGNTDQNVSIIGQCGDNCYIQQLADSGIFYLNNGNSANSYIRFENVGFMDANYVAWDNGGGAFLFGQASNIVFSQCTFVNNYARSEGGAVRVMAVTTLLFDKCSFVRNSAGVLYGGAVSLAPCCHTASNYVTFSNCLFDSNSAPQFGDVRVGNGFTVIFSGTNLMNTLPGGGGTIIYAPSPPNPPPSLQPSPPPMSPPCDASAPPSNGGVGDCINSLASGSTCQPTCNAGYTVSGTSSCDAGTLTAATCSENPCTASTDNSRDGSDGTFYCINGGTIGGTTGSCTCTSCNAGYEGDNCHTVSLCTASADSSKDGSDGTFYCINGGTVDGTTGSCTCTSCDAGYSGANCQVADVCAASTDSSKDGSDGNFHCINGGTVGGTTGSCTCTSCDAGYGGVSCQTSGACSASTDSSKDGSDGNFYCINGGTIGGTSGACTCTSCDTGYEG